LPDVSTVVGALTSRFFGGDFGGTPRFRVLVVDVSSAIFVDVSPMEVCP
jgi:hypothetical protein